MDLRTYLFHKRLSVTEFSKDLGCSRVHLSAIINGKRIPSVSLSKLIEKMTNGEVTEKELLDPKNGNDNASERISQK